MMDANGEHRWHRSAYPLQASSKSSVHSTVVTPSAEEVDNFASARFSKDIRSTMDPIVRYEAVEEDPSERPSTRYLRSIDGESSHEFPAAHDRSYQASIVTQSSSASLSGEVEYAAVSVHTPTISQSLDVLPGPWTRDIHTLGVIGSTSDHRSISSSPPPGAEHKPSSSQTPNGNSGAGERTLRRSPRSRQIRRRTPATPMTESAPQEQPKQSAIMPETSAWKRVVYPLASTTSSLPTKAPAQEPAQRPAEDTQSPADDADLGSPADSKHTSLNGYTAIQPSLQQPSSSSSTNSAASPSSSRRQSEIVTQTVSRQEQATSENSRKSNPWHRQRYPLQASATNEYLDNDEASASSHGETADPNELVTSQPQAAGEMAKERKPWHRKTYPLQAPASNMNLKGGMTRPLTHDDLEPPSETAMPQPRNDRELQDKESWQHKTYPLQALASNTTLENHVTPAASHGESEKPNDVGLRRLSNIKESKNGESWHRNTYPLQAPASRANLYEDWLTPPPSPQRESEHKRMPSTDQFHENDRGASRDSAFRRQMYPLQPPASITNSRHSSFSSHPMETEIQQPIVPSANQSRKNKSATEVVKRWRRQTYPLQSNEDDSPFERPQTPQTEQEAHHIPRPVHLPKNILALKDSENHESRGRTIVVCLDGTGDKFDNDNSNIVHLISALKKDDRRQMTYYQAGVGTYGAGGLSGGVTAAMDMAVGSSLGLHVRDAYHFLMHTYKEGDKICIFGFSRGAYTARCLAGMIHKIGLLPPRNTQQISFAYEFYKDDTPKGWAQSHDFKKTFCIDISVYFLGCFDSVASVGLIPRQLPLSSTPTNKSWYFRHAMALDERRAKFKICRHRITDFDDIKAEDELGDTLQMKYGKNYHPNLTDEEHERLEGGDHPFNSDVLEVWFAGAHADIGGGAVPNDERHKLAQIPLRWMIRQAFECNTGIIFNTAVLAEHGLDVHTLWPKYERLRVPSQKPSPAFLNKYEEALPPRSVRRSKLVPTDRYEKGEQVLHLKSHTDADWTPEQVEDFYDALSPLNDQLVQAPSWWILELLPVEYIVPIALDKVTTRVGMNFGQYRALGQNEPKVHWTAVHRAQHHNSYRIQARMAPKTLWRTVV